MKFSFIIVSQANNLRNYSCTEFVLSFLGALICKADKETTFYINHVLKRSLKIHLQTVLITPFTRNQYLKIGYLISLFSLSFSLV